MKKILSYLDFFKGHKTKVSSFLLVLALAFNLLWKTDFTGQELTGIFDQLTDQLEVMITAFGVAYGIIMKLARKIPTKKK